jgi:hypothetical protein
VLLCTFKLGFSGLATFYNRHITVLFIIRVGKVYRKQLFMLGTKNVFYSTLYRPPNPTPRAPSASTVTFMNMVIEEAFLAGVTCLEELFQLDIIEKVARRSALTKLQGKPVATVVNDFKRDSRHPHTYQYGRLAEFFVSKPQHQMLAKVEPQLDTKEPEEPKLDLLDNKSLVHLQNSRRGVPLQG